MSALSDPGSFRDPAGHVYSMDGRIFRTINKPAAKSYEALKASDFLEKITADAMFVGAKEVDPKILGAYGNGALYVVEHPRVPFISYPYEWSFPALKAAAVFHLDLHLKALDHGIALSDASAYNVQFVGTRPVFIDMLSFRPYREGEFWTGHAQFCEQFLNPLLLRALAGVSHNGWYRGNLEGIATGDLAGLIPFRRKLSWNVVTHVLLQNRMHTSGKSKTQDDLKKLSQKKLPLFAFQSMLKGLRSWIAALEPKNAKKTIWADYAHSNTYASEEAEAKRKFVSEFVENTKPSLLWDLGCNSGDYTAAALDAGAGYVVGFDFDQGALETAFARAEAKQLPFLPLYLDAANPSPSQGWRQHERSGMHARANADALIALAFEHHLAIGKNVPLDQVLDWLTDLAPQGVIEFVPKDDSTVRSMLALREDIFSDYDEDNFTSLLRNRARIVRSEKISREGRRLFWYERI